MEKAILATLAYAEAIGTPLTAIQIWRRLIASARLGSDSEGTFGQLIATLERMTEHGSVHERHGWYAPAGTDSAMFDRRLMQANVSAEKYQRMLRKAYWFQAVPFVRALAASGSLAQGTTDEQSDWDMFVVARSGRLYTARLGLVIAAKLMGVLRTKHQRVAPDTFCFNHYVSDSGLTIRHRSLYVAYALDGLVPLLDETTVLGQLRHENVWVREYLANAWSGSVSTVRRQVHPSRALRIVRKVLEALLAPPLGDIIERNVRRWQQRRIEQELATHAKGGRVVADNQEIEFHPRSAERKVVARYNASVAFLGVPAPEKDSGLT